MDEDGDGLCEAGLPPLADRVAGPLERGNGAVGAAGVWLGERARPGVAAARRHMPLGSEPHSAQECRNGGGEDREQRE